MQLNADDLEFSFVNRAPLFSGLSLELTNGTLASLTGPSGSGKTTLLSILAGWVAPTRGRVTRRGVDRMNWVPQNPHGSNTRTALSHVVLPFLAQGLTRRDAANSAEELLASFDLEGVRHTTFGNLSGGEAQRLMLASALAARPQLLLVDEPTAQLDPHGAQTVINVLQRLAAEERIVVISTHDRRVSDICPISIDLLRDGRV